MGYTPLEIKNASVKAAVGAGVLTEYADAVASAKLATEFKSAKFRGISGKSANTAGSLDDSIVVEVGDSAASADFWMFLRTNHGKTGKVEFYPVGGATPKIAADVMFVAPGSLGGAEGEINTSSVTLPCLTAATITGS